jgi:hypothetical protein
MKKIYINDFGHEVPQNKILLIPHIGLFDEEKRNVYLDIVKPLRGKVKRDWFDKSFYHCLPLVIGNQYGFTIHAAYDFQAIWDGNTGQDGRVEIVVEDSEYLGDQIIEDNFGYGIITISHKFAFKTPPGINLMTIQPPNHYTPGVVTMTGVIETDQLRRDFSFNLKLTDHNRLISFKRGDVLAAFIPTPRYFIDSFELGFASDHFSPEILNNEFNDQLELNRQRNDEDLQKRFDAGKKYFNGEHAFGCPYKDHQKRI